MAQLNTTTEGEPWTIGASINIPLKLHTALNFDCNLNIWHRKELIRIAVAPLSSMSTTPKINPSLPFGCGNLGTISKRSIYFHSGYHLYTRKWLFLFPSRPSFLISSSLDTQNPFPYVVWRIVVQFQRDPFPFIVKSLSRFHENACFLALIYKRFR